MITGLGIRTAVVEILNRDFFEFGKVLDSSIVEDYVRPCFFVYMDHYAKESLDNGYDRRIYTVQIHYQGRSDIELMELAESLSEAFTPILVVGDRCIDILTTQATLEPQNLFFEVQASFTTRKKARRGQREKMETLDFNIKRRP